MDPKKAQYVQSGQQAQKAAFFTSYGANLQVDNNIAVNADLPEENVLIQVYSSSVNPVDWKIRKGDLKMVTGSHFPQIPGRDISGKIVKLGAKVTSFKVGDEVYGMPEALIGSYCEYVNCSYKSIARKPEKLSWNEAAALPLCTLTAHEAIVQIGQIAFGESILILGGSSGVGHLGIQIAKAAGAVVYTTCGTDNVEWVKALGADVVIDYKKQDFYSIVQGLGPVDVVFDAIGNRDDRDKSFDLVKPKGRVVTTTPNDDRNTMGVGEALRTAGDIVWKKVSNYIANGVSYKPFFCADYQGHVLAEVNLLIEQGKYKVKIDSVHPLEQIQAASDKSESGKLSGKIVIEIKKD